MNFVDLKRETLTVTYGGVTYSKELYVSASSVTGITDESYPSWNVATTYTVGAYVIVPELKSIYKNLLLILYLRHDFLAKNHQYEV